MAAILHSAAVGGGSLFCRFLAAGEVDGPLDERTFAEFCQRCLRLASGLQEAGARGERVLLLYPPGVAFAEGFVACVLAGAVAVPALPPDPSRLERTLPRLTRMVVDANARFVLAPDELCAMAAPLSELAPELARRPWLAAEACAGSTARWRDPGALPDTLAYLQYTSGSTGEPKGVRVTHANLIHNSANIAAAFGSHAGSAGVIWLPPYHDMGLIGGILQPLIYAFPVWWMSPLDFLRRPGRWLRAISASRASISGGPDFAYALCTRKVRDEELDGVDLSCWEVAFTGAEPVRVETLDGFTRRFAAYGFSARALYPTYGLAESTLIVAGGRVGAGPRTLELDAAALGRGELREGHGRTLVSCGAATAGMELAIVDPVGLQRTDAVGELWIAGPSVADGYWGQPEATRETFAARTADGAGPFLRTGDLGLVRDGELYIVGRQKDVVIVRGRNIYPADVEVAIAAAHPAIRQGGVAVFAVEHGGEERAAAAIEVDPKQLAGTDDVIDAVRRAAFEQGAAALAGVVLLPPGALPKTTSGKVQRFGARELYLQADAPALARWVEAAPGADPQRFERVRQRLLETVAPHLGVAPERVDTGRAFDTYGVDSARLVEMSEAVERAFGRTIAPSTLYNHPTLDALARHLASGEAEVAPAPVEAAVYRDHGEELERLDRRATGYRFDLEADMPWDRLAAPGIYVPEELAAALGVDVAALRAEPGAWELFDWAMALEICTGFEALELALIAACGHLHAAHRPSRSLTLLIEEEHKHILLFRRYAGWLRELRPDDGEVFARVPSSWANRRGAAWLELGGAAGHLRWWLRTLLFEAWTVHLHEALTRSDAGLQPAWLAAHALHRREEAQHLATDLAFVAALELSDAERRRGSAGFLLELLDIWPEFFGVQAVHEVIAERFPGKTLRAADAVVCAQRLLGERSFTSLHRAAPGLAELLALPADEVRAAAEAIAGGRASPARAVELRAADRPAASDEREAAGASPRDREERGNDIAIVGVGCRFPGDIDSLDRLWARLVERHDAITEVPANRWDIDAYYDPDPRSPGRMNTRWGGFVTGVEDFDAAFFGISPREVRSMDPQQRLLLEVSWEALEHAGIAPATLAGTRAGVWVGICSWDYARRNNEGLQDPWSATGNALSVAAGRISYTFGLRGPSMAVDTACSSSLVAVHLAVQSLRRGESELALVGGVNLLLSPLSTICFSALRAMSPVGRCKTFDASADGYVRSEGCGVVVLKRLADARRDGDRVLAVIRGTAVNQDGRSNGLTAPHGPAQEDVIRTALADAGLEACDIGYLEAHGTGTPLGDPIELGAIAAVMAERGVERPLWVGSVKTNIGHCEGASGLAGLAKAIEILRRGEIPANLHFTTPTPQIAWSGLPIAVPTTLQRWDRDAALRVGINSFGFGGTNAHAVLEGAEEFLAPDSAAPAMLVLPLSAPTREGLRTLAGRLAAHIEAHPDEALADVCATLACGRNAWRERVAVIVAGRAALIADLRGLAAGELPPSVIAGPEDGAASELRVAFLFTGQGSQSPGMARALYEALPPFRAALDRVTAELGRWLERPIQPLMFAEAGPEIHATGNAQPALFALEWALVETWRGLGVEPCAVIGHSIGELAAACVAGVMSLADAARLVATRGRLMQSLPGGGAMASVDADEASVTPVIAAQFDRVDIAAVNGPRQVVISGDEEAVEAALRELASRGLRSRRLTVSHAFHSPRMEPILEAFEAEARRVTLTRPRLPLISNLTGRTAGADVARAGYWALHVRAPVRFGDGIATLIATQRPGLLLEVGPAPVLAGLCVQAGVSLPIAASLRSGQPDPAVFATALARLWTHGAAIRWSTLYGRRRRLTLPGTPMQRTRHWIEAAPRQTTTSVGAAQPWLGVKLDLAGRAVFESEIGEQALTWLREHRVGERAIVPFTGFVALARLAALHEGLGAALGEVVVEAPLAVNEGESHRMQATITDDRVSVHVRARDGWRRHFAATARSATATPEQLDLAAIAARCPQPWSAEVIHAALAAVGLPYGPRFRGLHAAARGEAEVLAELRAPAELAGDPAFVRDIALLDAALQAAALLLADAGALHLPVGAEAVSFAALPDRAWVHATLRPGEGPLRRVDLVVADERGLEVARVQGLALQRVGPAVNAAPLVDEAWILAATPVEAPTLVPTRALIVGADPVAARLAEQLSEGTEIIDVGDLEALAAKLRTGRFTALVSLLGLVDAPIEATLAVIRAAAVTNTPRVLVVTRGGFVMDGERTTASSIAQAGLWGLARSAALELPATSIRLVDLDPRDDPSAAGAALARELGEDRESQLVWRDGQRHGLRLAPAPGDELERPDGGARLIVDRTAGGLRLEPIAAREPGPGEVAIAVEFAGLNFRDVLGALGRYPGAVGPLGGECCGRVIAVGAGVTELAPGDRVMALAPASFADLAYTDARLAVRVPAGLTSEEAATVPVAFATAWYGLHVLGRLQAGERVLIHAAAGGVGMAAVQLAQRAGAELFGTASAAKWPTLIEMGIAEPLSSRDTSFAPAIRAATRGEGVDLVLNSLTGEILAESVRLLRGGGRFLEMGKAEIWDDARVAAVNPRASYVAFDLATVDPAQIGAILREIAAGFERGELRPLPHRVVPLTRAPTAVRDMAAARHIGKLVLQVPRDLPIDPEGGYLVTGATGGLGAHVARWLLARGARHLALAGRRSPDPALLAELRAGGATVYCATVDLAEPGGVRALLAELRPVMPRLRGVVHAAGVVADAALTSLDAAAFARVIAPKAGAAWELSEETCGDPLHLFVLFASASGVLGGAGQANYAAANAMLDALARGRRSAGRVGLAIDWGPWAGDGMAGRLDPALQRRLLAQGIRPLEPARALQHLGLALRSSAAQVAVLPLDRARLASRFAAGPVPPLLAGIVAQPAPAAAPASGLRDSLLATAPAQRSERLVGALRELAAQVLGTRPATVDPRRPLSELGLDSLMAVDLQNTVASALGVTLAPTVLLEHPTLTALASAVLRQLGLAEVDTPAATPAPDAATLALQRELAALEAVMA
ncbi:MAG: SDR family NAD(P)-dependent oxidoreductase [Nannocystis sp.]|nr:SDR family NAD(P)-dependent oxidoreductase [Nannocystis sp.]